jgi:sugar-specific transcriptional regulator TrmB
MPLNFELTQQLEQLGFSDKEAQVYLALLEFGRGTVTQIAQKAGINRTTGYSVLSALVSKGIVTASGKEPKQEYVAESPETITSLLRDRITHMQAQLSQAESLIPKLKSVHSVKDRPQIVFYEGTKGLEQVYEDTLTAKEPIRAYANVSEMHQALPKYFPKYYQRRAGKGIAIRAIIPSNEAGKKRADKDALEKRESALIPPNEYYFAPEICIYDNKTMIASWREKLGIIIESQEIADAMKVAFELAWKEAKRLEKESEKPQQRKFA